MHSHENLWRAWSFAPAVLVAAAVASGFFVHGWLRLRRRRAALAPWTRLLLFLTGVLVTLAAIVSPIDHIGEESLQSAHMLQHVLIADVGIVLIILALRGALTVFFLPRSILAPLARMRPVRATLRFLLRPAVSYVVWVAVLVFWHIPVFYEAALSHGLAHDAEHLSFVIAGALIWAQIIDPSRHRRLSLAERLGYTALVFWTGQILAFVILFSFEPLYATYLDQPDRLFGLSALTDQRIAGVVMMVEQILTVGVAFVLLLRAVQRQRTGAPTLANGQRA